MNLRSVLTGEKTEKCTQVSETFLFWSFMVCQFHHGMLLVFLFQILGVKQRHANLECEKGLIYSNFQQMGLNQLGIPRVS